MQKGDAQGVWEIRGHTGVVTNPNNALYTGVVTNPNNAHQCTSIREIPQYVPPKIQIIGWPQAYLDSKSHAVLLKIEETWDLSVFFGDLFEPLKTDKQITKNPCEANSDQCRLWQNSEKIIMKESRFRFENRLIVCQNSKLNSTESLHSRFFRAKSQINGSNNCTWMSQEVSKWSVSWFITYLYRGLTTCLYYIGVNYSIY